MGKKEGVDGYTWVHNIINNACSYINSDVIG